MPLHPEIAARLPLVEGIGSFDVGGTDPAARDRLVEFTTYQGRPAASVGARGAEVPGPHGPVPVRVYTPAVQGPGRACLVWLHGGAFQHGDMDMAEADSVAREVCARADAVVVSVDYRLATGGASYPVPHDDVVAALRWVREGAEALGVDPGRIRIGGASAGANLAAGAVLRVRDDDGWVPAGLLLVYPTVHADMPEPSVDLAVATAGLPPVLRFHPAKVREMYDTYLGDTPADGYSIPALARLDGLPPTVVLDAEYDDLRGSGEAFAERLVASGVPVHRNVVAGMPHGFLNMTLDWAEVDDALDLLAAMVAAP